MLRGILMGGMCVLVWGITFVNTKALLTEFSALEIQILRFAAAWAVLWAIYPTREKTTFRENAVFAGMGLTGVAVYQFLENSAIHYTNASNVSILVAAAPMAAALLERIFGRGRLGVLFGAGFVLAMVGVLFVSLEGIQTLHFHPIGDAMALGAMLSWGLYTLLADFANESGHSQGFAIRRTFGWGLILLLPLALTGLTPWGRNILGGTMRIEWDLSANLVRFSNLWNVFHLCFLGLLASAACFVLWNKACAILGAVRCSTGLYLIPVVGVLCAHFFLGESMGLRGWCGAGLVLAGVVLSGRVGKS